MWDDRAWAADSKHPGLSPNQIYFMTKIKVSQVTQSSTEVSQKKTGSYFGQ